MTLNWQVKNVIVQNNYMLLLTFADGTKKLYDCKPLLDKGIFKALSNPELFNNAHIAFNTVVWNDTIDIDPEELYYNSVSIA